MKTEEQEYIKLAETSTVVPVYREILADMETPVSVLRRFSDAENVFLLESVEGGETWGRYSFIGVDPEPLLDVDHRATGEGPALSDLRNVYLNEKTAMVKGLPRFCGGAVGFIGYEAVGEFERMPPPQADEGGLECVSRFVRADKLVVFDNVRHTIKIVVCTRPAQFASPSECYRDAMGVIDGIETRIRKSPGTDAPKTYPTPEFMSNMEREEYCRIVEKAREYIYAGDVIQVVLSQRFTAKSGIPPFQLYRALRLLNPSPYMFFLKTGERTLVGSSPEVMVRLTGNRIELRPIAGTRPRGGNEQEDRALADELLSDEKEKAEHVMLVDLGRNDIGRVAETGSVQVREYMTIERYSHVMHIVSHVEGMLLKGKDACDVLKATFPAGTLSGAPKIRAMEIINELEKGPRGTYGGAVGYVGYDGNMDFAITIRTMDIKDSRINVQAGAGIVYNSVPEKEFEETCHKAQGMRKAVELAAKGLEL